MAPTHHTAAGDCLQNSWCQTDIKLAEVRYIWTIRNFNFCQEDTGECLRPSFFGTVGGPEWALKLYPNGRAEADKEYVSLFLEINYSDKCKGYPEVKYKFSFLKSDQEDVLLFKNDAWWKFTESKKAHGYWKLMKRVELIKLLSNDQLIICCEIAMPAAKICTSDSNKIAVPECTLSDDLGSMFSNQRFGNTVIRVADKDFVVCKEILQARSHVFAAMFDHETEEKNQNRIIIKDFQPNVVEEMLKFIYTDKSPNLKDMANDMLFIADKYDLRRLKTMSEDVLSRNITEENAIKILISADLCGANELKTRAIKFIMTNGSHFLEGSFWENTVSLLSEHQNLIAELFKALFALNNIK